MKIYRVEVKPEFRPGRQNFVWPPQNRRGENDYGVEQDFDAWLLSHPEYLCDQPIDADWIYAPIYLNRYYINTPNESGNWGGGLDALSEEVSRCRSFGDKVFTISEADVRVIKPMIDWGDMVIFCASRRQDSKDIDIPLLSAPHVVPKKPPAKKHLACFLGNLQTDGIRMQMRDALAHRKDCRIEHANYSDDYYATVMLESYIALAPRGQGAQSFRFYEAMALGVVPYYISDLDCRPFSRYIDWDICSLYSSSVDDVNTTLESLSGRMIPTSNLTGMGGRAKRTYDDHLAYGKWCKYVLRELELL